MKCETATFPTVDVGEGILVAVQTVADRVDVFGVDAPNLGGVASEHAVLDRGMAKGVVAFRGMALGWAWVGLVLERDHLDRVWLAVLALAAATSFTFWVAVVVARGVDGVLKPMVIAGELALGAGLLIVDGVVYDVLRQQSLPWAWPAAGIITAAVVGGVRWGLVASALVAGASFVGESILRGTPEWTISAASKSALWVLAAVVAGVVARRLRVAEDAVSSARSREEMARVLHDGVLQTLAVISRRSADEELRALAAEQERELRAYVAAQQHSSASLAAALRRSVDAVVRRHGLVVELVVAEDLPTLAELSVRAVAGAVGEALANAAKHSGVDRVVVFVEPGEDEHEVFCSVRDNGVGFDPNEAQSGWGLRHSIRDRIEEIGGRVEIDARIGRGTEVRLWVS